MKTNQLARESFWGSIVTYIGVLIGFITTFFILTTYLTKEEVGLTRIVVEIATFLSGFGVLGLSTSISRYFPYFREDNSVSRPQQKAHRGFLFWILSITTFGLLLILPIYGIGAEWLNKYLGNGSRLLGEYYWCVLPLTAIIAYWTVIELYSIQLMHLAIPRVIRELGLRLFLIATYAFYALDWISFSGLIYLFVASYLFSLLLSTLYLGRIAKLSLRREANFPDAALKNSFVHYTSFAILSTVGTTLAGRMDIFALSFLPSAGLGLGAVFTIGFFIVSIVEIPTRAIIGLATAQIADLMAKENYSAVKILYEKVSRFQLLCSIVIYVAIYVSINEIIGLMPRASEYAEARTVFMILGLSKLIEVCFTVCHPIVNTSKYYQWSFYYTLVCILVSFCANLLFIPRWGVGGAAAATCLTTTLGYALLQVVIGRKLGVHPFSKKLMFSVFLGLGLFALAYIFPSVGNLTGILSIIVRSGCIGLVALGAIYLLGLAPEGEAFIKNQFNQVWRKIK